MLPDEGRYVGVAWEMLQSGDWLTPTLDGLPYFHKPPLFYWITAGSLGLFGPNEWAARVAPLFGAWLGAMSIFLFLRRWWSRRAAHLALVALLMQPLFFLGGQFANLDMLVAGCITATIVLLAHAALCAEQGLPMRRHLAGAFVMAGFGVLAKGLIGVVLPVLVIGIWLLALRRWRAMAALLWWPGIALFLVVTAPWFIAMQQRFPNFLDYFFVVQHFKRFASGGFNNVQPFWFYPAVLVGFSLPWLPWLWGLFKQDSRTDRAPAPLRLLMMLWIVVVVLFFSLPQSKLLGYVLPAVPPLAVLVADGFATLGMPTLRSIRLWRTSIAVSASLGLAAVSAAALYPMHSSRELASILAARRSPTEPVLMLGNYYFDLPFYARLRGHVLVIDDWAAPDIRKRDNWRQELADAGRFAPTLAASVLALPTTLDATLCRAPVSWVIGPVHQVSLHPVLAKASERSRRDDTVLWQIDRALPEVAGLLRCEETPNDWPADK